MTGHSALEMYLLTERLARVLQVSMAAVLPASRASRDLVKARRRVSVCDSSRVDA